MRLKKSLVAGALVLLCAGGVEAGLSDLLKRSLVKLVEQQEIKKAPDCTLSADEALAQAVELLSDGRQAEAEDLVESAAKSHRDDVRILFAKAVLDRSRWSKASANVWFAMARKAKGNEALSRAAWLSMKLDRQEEAAGNIAELIRLSDENPDNIFLLWLGAIQCREQGKGNVSKKQRQEMAEIGKVRYEMLLKHFRLGPVLLHHTYANTLDDLQEYEEALEHRTLAVSMEAKGWSLDGLAFTLYKLKKYDRSNAIYARVLRRNPSGDTYWARWGNTLSAMKRYEEAEEKYRRALHLAPKEGWIWDNLGRCLHNLGKDEEQFEAYQQAVDLGCDSGLDGLGLCYEYGRGVAKDEEKAFELYWLYKEKNPNSVWAANKLAHCYSSGMGVEKDVLKGRQYFEEAVRLDPDNSSALNELAWNLAVFEDALPHDFPRAIKLLKRSVALDEKEYTLDILTVAYFDSGQYEKALEALEHLIQFHRVQDPGIPVPEHLVKRRAEYKKVLLESGGSL